MSDIKQMQAKYWARFFETSKMNNKYWNKARSHMIQIIIQNAFWLEGWMNTREMLIGVEIVCHGEQSKENFRILYQQKEEIESDVRFALKWQERPDIVSSYIRIEKYVESFHEQNWKEQHEWLFENLKTFHRVFVPFIRKLGYIAPDISL